MSSLIEPADERKETLASQIYERLRQEIITVALPPGEKLAIKPLCERFDVGLSPVREALSRLSMEGLVSQSDHRGFMVAAISEADLVDLTRARCWVNEVAIRNSIANGDVDWEENVVLSFHRLTRTPRFAAADASSRSIAWERAHRAFHTSLISASGSVRLEQFCEHLFDSSERYRHLGRLAGVPGGNVPGENRETEHRAVMEAVVARDAELAARLIRAHFERTAEMVREVLARRGG